MLQYLLATNYIDIIAGDLYYDFLKVPQNKFLNILTDHIQIINKPRYISESLIDHVYIKKSLIEEFFTNATVANIYFSDHDVVGTVIEKNCLDFHTNP